MKNLSYLLTLFTLFTLLCCVSCSEDNSCEDIVIEEKDVRMTDVSGITLNYTKDLEIGGKENEILFEKWSDILLNGQGHKWKKTLDCYGLAAMSVNGMEVDSTKHVERVTIINRGTITVHTKDLVERYKHLIATPQDPDRPYFYLRVLALYAGRNCSIINKGVINVYFDHDPLNTSTIYTIALTGDDGSTVINEGEIHFFGTGSVNTRFRGIATQGDNVTAINKGLMTSEVEMVDDQRMITTGGKYNNIINDGIMRLYGPGEICGLSASTGNNAVNNNLIEITHVDMPDKYMTVEQETGIVGGIYCSPSLGAITPPVMNRGTINMKAITTSKTPPTSTVHGMFFDYSMGAEANVVNEGTITTIQTGPTKIRMAEAFFRSRDDKPVKAKMGRWNTTLRDFTQQPLFMGDNVAFNFTNGELMLLKENNYVEGTFYSVAPECLLIQDGTNVYSGYENMTIASKDKNDLLHWDKKKQEVSLSLKK